MNEARDTRRHEIAERIRAWIDPQRAHNVLAAALGAADESPEIVLGAFVEAITIFCVGAGADSDDAEDLIVAAASALMAAALPDDVQASG